MSIEDLVKKRGIEEVMHFTTNRGLTGILALKKVLPRLRLAAESYLEHIYKHNCPDRSRDEAWHDYVNLSLTSINGRLFGTSSNCWHSGSDVWWCILSFRPEILSHQGVHFATTNNMYSGVHRRDGEAGLTALFAPTITQWCSYRSQSSVSRSPGTPDAQPTCAQAEVLYPGELSIDHLRCIYIRDEDCRDAVCGMMSALSVAPIECVVSPRHFTH